MASGFMFMTPPIKILLPDSNYIVVMVVWLKFGSSAFYDKRYHNFNFILSI